jgi:putative transposase
MRGFVYDTRMNAPRCDDIDYINYLIASPRTATCTEAARVQPPRPDAPSHDAFSRLLYRADSDPEALWTEAKPLVRRTAGALVLDDSTLDKPYAQKIQPVGWHWSGKHRAVVRGINLISLVWTDGDRTIPCDFRVYDKARDGHTKNDHFRAMLQTAAARGFTPQCVLFDQWYASLENLKAIRALGWRWLTQLKGNRRVNPDGSGLIPVSAAGVTAAGRVVHLEGYGRIKVFAIAARDGGIEYWATDDLAMSELTRLELTERVWAVEEYHRGLKQYCGVERCQARGVHAQRNHIGLAIRALLRLEWHRYTTGVSWAEAKASIIREALRRYLAAPLYALPGTA